MKVKVDPAEVGKIVLVSDCPFFMLNFMVCQLVVKKPILRHVCKYINILSREFAG